MKKTGIFKFIKPYLFQCIISMLLSVITVLLTLVIPIFTGEAIDLMLGQAGVDIDGVIRYVIIIAIIIPVNALLTYLMNMINSHICYGVSKDMRQTLFAHLMKLDISFFDRCGQGDPSHEEEVLLPPDNELSCGRVSGRAAHDGAGHEAFP